MKYYFQSILCFFFLTTVVYAEDTKVDILLEKIQQSKTKEEKQNLLSQLKIELAKINKQSRDESNAIVEAKKKLPSKPFNTDNILK